MAEYIEREALLSLETIMVDPEGFEHSCVLSVDVRSAPAADVVEVVHSHWVHDSNNLYGCYECMERETMSPKKLKPYCPNCGAKMDGE